MPLLLHFDVEAVGVVGPVVAAVVVDVVVLHRRGGAGADLDDDEATKGADLDDDEAKKGAVVERLRWGWRGGGGGLG